MGPKIEAACRFARKTAKRATIGEVAELSHIIAGEAGTTVCADRSGIAYA
jgi:carbamate kinase